MRTTRTSNGKSGQSGYSSDPRAGARKGAQYGSQYGAQPRGAIAPAPKASAKHAGASKPPKKPLVGVGAAVLLVALAAVIAAGIYQTVQKNALYSNTFTPGVTINGQDVSGREVEQYRTELKEQFRQKIANIAVQIQYGDKSWTLSGADLGAAENVDDTVNRAAALAREGTAEQRAAEARQVRKEGRAFDAAISVDQSMLTARLNAIADEVSMQGHDATVTFNPDAMSFVDPEEPTKSELADLDKMFTVNGEVAGKTVDVERMAREITEDLKGDYAAKQQLRVNEFVPGMTAEKLRKCFHHIATFRTKISSASTDERVHNITTALSKFNGLVLNPGEELSFNATTGPRTEANDYQMAHVINNGAYVDDWGGGVCQASTTLYNATLLAGCEIISRSNHSIPSDYVKLGFDAMVNYPNGDFKFKNVSGGPIYIKAWVSSLKNVYVMIFGEPLIDNASVQESYPGAVRIDRTSETIFRGDDPGTETLVDETGAYADQAPYSDSKPYVTMKPHPELKVDVYLIYYGVDGKEIGRKKLYQDHFEAKKGTQYIGKNPRPGSTTQPNSTEGAR